jgi:hypothetical protein
MANSTDEASMMIAHNRPCSSSAISQVKSTINILFTPTVSLASALLGLLP